MIIAARQHPLAAHVQVFTADGHPLMAFWVDTEKRTAKAYVMDATGKKVVVQDGSLGVYEVENVTVKLKPNFPEHLRPLVPPELRP